MLRRELTEEDLIEKDAESNRVRDIQNQNQCPTCYNFINGGIYEDFSERLIYEDDFLYCFLEKYPRSEGHTIILVKDHYEDITFLSDELLFHVMKISNKMNNAIKQVLGAPKVYLCTMCDGKRNHFHLQLIPRLDGEKIGSSNFNKERGILVNDNQIINQLKNAMKN